MFWVYILKCIDNSYYTGHTDNLENRIMQHNHKHFPACFTATRLPVQLVFSEEFNTREEALASERQIKRWSRKKKEALINNDWTLRDGAAHLLRANGKKNLQINRTVVRLRGNDILTCVDTYDAFSWHPASLKVSGCHKSVLA